MFACGKRVHLVMANICVIPARGGSKGLPGKNLRLLAGRPLLVHSIEDAREAQGVDAVLVSTDDKGISAVAREHGASVIERPAEFATDTASSEAALLHALEVIESQGMRPELVVFLQCTSPFRTGADIDGAIEKLRHERADSLLSVSPSHRFLWREANGQAEPINYDYRHRPRRQDMSRQFVENGSIYVFKPWVLRETGNRLGGRIALYPMSERAALEIDSVLDFSIAESLMEQDTC
jgi:N-acylneuraminate cytidylyltransferase